MCAKFDEGAPKILASFMVAFKGHMWCMDKYLHLPSIFPIKCVGDPSAFMKAWLPRDANQHSTTYIVLP